MTNGQLEKQFKLKCLYSPLKQVSLWPFNLSSFQYTALPLQFITNKITLTGLYQIAARADSQGLMIFRKGDQSICVHCAVFSSSPTHRKVSHCYLKKPTAKIHEKKSLIVKWHIRRGWFCMCSSWPLPLLQWDLTHYNVLSGHLKRKWN